MPIVSDAVQLAGFLFAGWLLFRFTDWIYRRGAGREAPDRTTAADRAPALPADQSPAPAIVADHGEHGPPPAAHAPGAGARRDDLRDVRRSSRAQAVRH